MRAAAASGRWADELHVHAATCRHCGDVARIASAFAGPWSRPAASVNPGLLWMRARLERRRRAEMQVSRVLMGGQIAIGSIVAGAFVVIGRQVAWWSTTADASIPASLAAIVGVLMLAGLAAASLVSRES